MELSKSDRKVAQEIIEKGLQREYAKGLFYADAILHEWKSKSTGNREAFWVLYSHFIEFNKQIAQRYDQMTGSNYLFIIAGQLQDRLITEDDLSKLSFETKGKIRMIAEL